MAALKTDPRIKLNISTTLDYTHLPKHNTESIDIRATVSSKTLKSITVEFILLVRAHLCYIRGNRYRSHHYRASARCAAHIVYSISINDLWPTKLLCM